MHCTLIICLIGLCCGLEIFPCPDVLNSSAPFSLPGSGIGGWIPALGVTDNTNNYVAGPGTGFEFIDVNDDGLPDLVWSFYMEGVNSAYQCVYLNTQCGWGESSRYTKDSTTCYMTSRSILSCSFCCELFRAADMVPPCISYNCPRCYVLVERTNHRRHAP